MINQILGIVLGLVLLGCNADVLQGPQNASILDVALPLQENQDLNRTFPINDALTITVNNPRGSVRVETRPAGSSPQLEIHASYTGKNEAVLDLDIFKNQTMKTRVVYPKMTDEEGSMLVGNYRDLSEAEKDQISSGNNFSNVCINGVCMSSPTADIAIYLPAEFIQNLKIESQSGKIVLSHFEGRSDVADQAIVLMGGDILVEHSNFTHGLYAETSMGSIEVKNSSGDLLLKGGHDDCSVSDHSNGVINASTLFGEIKLKSIQNTAIVAETKMGEILPLDETYQGEKFLRTRKSKISDEDFAQQAAPYLLNERLNERADIFNVQN